MGRGVFLTSVRLLSGKIELEHLLGLIVLMVRLAGFFAGFVRIRENRLFAGRLLRLILR